MSTFATLYGDKLSEALGSSDTSNLFTTARRKAAINDAARWWNAQTECLTRTAEIAVVDGTSEYDLIAGIADGDFLKIAKRGPVLKADPGGGETIIYYSGEDFERVDVAWLDDNEPGWRSAGAGTPSSWYEREDGGQRLFGLYVPPDVPAGATWTILVPYVVLLADMSTDAAVPFTISGHARTDLAPWHDALPLYAASELEKLRKGIERSIFLRQQAEQRVLDWFDKIRVPGGKRLKVARSYRRESRTMRAAFWDNSDPWK